MHDGDSNTSDDSTPSFLNIESSLSGRRWLSLTADEACIADWVRHYAVSDLVARLLVARSIPSEQATDYLKPTLKKAFPDPSSFADMDKAAQIVLDAIINRRKVCVFADYDVDGACSAALLIRYFRCWGLDLRLYVPDRLREGYGPTPQSFAALQSEGIELVITVDCGAAAHKALHAAAQMDLDVIVLDHHLMHGPLPPALALVNPNRPDCSSGCGKLAATGLVYVFLVALNRLARQRDLSPLEAALPDLLKWLDLCALGTVCDVVPLHGINRALVSNGLKVLARTPNPGLQALISVCGLSQADSVYHLGFVLGPRLNAGGRIHDSSMATRLLTTDDRAEAVQLAEKLHAINDDRKRLEARITEQAVDQAQQRLDANPDLSILVLGAQDWHPGIIGIVAGRLKARYHRPVIIIGWGEEFGPLARGSGRSVPGINLGAIIESAVRAGQLRSGGGHAMAIGLSLEPENFAALREYMEQHVSIEQTDLKKARQLSIDSLLAPSAAGHDLLEQLAPLEPFGAGNPEPVFAMAGIRIESTRIVGESHIALQGIGEDGAQIRAIAFHCVDTDLGEAILSGETLHLAGRIRPDSWRGKNATQLEIIDAARPNTKKS